MVTNVIRIIVLVFFRIPPENPMHELIGVLCLIVYVVIPLHFFGVWLVRKYGKARHDEVSKPLFIRRYVCHLIILPLLVFCIGTTIDKNGHSSLATHANVHFGKIEAERLRGGISKISTNELLIYVKTIPQFFTGEHTPLMCWKGSGFEFAGVATRTIGEVTIYKGKLVKEGKCLHTAWWYSNGKIETISQLDWRMRMLKGEPKFCLVNVTAEDEQTLMQAVTSMFANNQLTINN
jgi:exosortase N